MRWIDGTYRKHLDFKLSRVSWPFLPATSLTLTLTLTQAETDFYAALEIGLNQDNSKLLGKRREDDDFSLAVEQFQKDQEDLLNSYKLAKSIEKSNGIPVDLLKRLEMDVVQERQDHLEALRISGKKPPQTESHSEIENYLKDLKISYPPEYVTKLPQILPNLPNTIATHIATLQELSGKNVCNSCLEPVAIYTLSCTHSYCLECFKSLAKDPYAIAHMSPFDAARS